MTQEDYITLGEAAKLAPGRPSVNACWRWARKGVKARSGQRIRLRHIRAGGRVLTTAAWVEQFTRELADADAEHFDAEADKPKQTSTDKPEPTGRAEHERARQRLAAQGLD
jgi:hypothetical protein